MSRVKIKAGDENTRRRISCNIRSVRAPSQVLIFQSQYVVCSEHKSPSQEGPARPKAPSAPRRTLPSCSNRPPAKHQLLQVAASRQPITLTGSGSEARQTIRKAARRRPPSASGCSYTAHPLTGTQDLKPPTAPGRSPVQQDVLLDQARVCFR